MADDIVVFGRNAQEHQHPDLATVDAPLRELTKKSVEFHWSPDQENRFKKIQQFEFL